MGILIVIVYYNLSSKLKFFYTDIKNNYSNDNKYLAVVNDTGLWLKMKVKESILITKSKNISNNLLTDVVINEFSFDFKLKRQFKQIK